MTKTIAPDSDRRLHLDRRAEALVVTAPEAANDDLLTTHQVASWFGVTAQWVELARAGGYGPPFTRIAPQAIRYKRATVIDWLKDREHKRISDYADIIPRRKTPARKRKAAVTS
jgi:hypothetical protein